MNDSAPINFIAEFTLYKSKELYCLSAHGLLLHVLNPRGF